MWLRVGLPVGIVLAILLFGVLPTIFIALHVYRKFLVRTSKDKWGRVCSDVTNEEQMEMFRRGTEWGKSNAEYRKEVSVISDGLRLVGEYFDFGYDKAVIIIAGRTEGCTYSQYFAPPYASNGYNVLTIDNRAHGLSEGKYNCVGLKEYRDILSWGKLLHDEYGVKEVLIHGICIGSATGLYAMTAQNTPAYFTGIVTDGMYTTFYETFKNHMIEDKHPLFPVLQEVMLLIKIRSGVDAVHNGPIYCIDKLNKPILMIYTKQDKFSLPDKAQLLYEKCKAPKRIAWFEKGGHSHVRINDEEGYDRVITQFLNDKNSMQAE